MYVIEDRIRQLCAQAVAAQNEAALEKAVSELNALIRVHIYNVRVMAAAEIPRLLKPMRDAA